MTQPITAVPVIRVEKRLGQYAGLVALAIDTGALWGIFALGLAAVTLFISLIAHRTISLRGGIAEWIGLVVWVLFYFTFQWSLGGRTIGMALMGLRVVRRDGSAVGARTAFVRTLGLALCLPFFVLVTLAMLIQRERRALDDLIAGTAVVYSWDARAARLRWLAHRDPLSEAKPRRSP
jgi:uncharacterized RDD family membrane protein YckC